MTTPGGDRDAMLLQNAATATGNGLELTVTDASGGGKSYLAVQVSGTHTSVVTFEVTVDGTNWVSLLMTNITTGATATTATNSAENGIYVANVLGVTKFRARVTWTSGTSVSVYAQVVA